VSCNSIPLSKVQRQEKSQGFLKLIKERFRRVIMYEDHKEIRTKISSTVRLSTVTAILNSNTQFPNEKKNKNVNRG